MVGQVAIDEDNGRITYNVHKTFPVASPEADDEDEDYHVMKSYQRDQRSWEKYCMINSRPTAGMAPSRIQWEYRSGVSKSGILCNFYRLQTTGSKVFKVPNPSSSS